MTADRILHLLGFVAAAAGLALTPIAQFTDLLSTEVQRGALIGIGAVLVVLFLRMVFSRDIQYAVAQANADMRGGRPYRVWMSPFDPVWGLFGSKMGDFPTKLVRALGALEFAGLMIVEAFSGHRYSQPPLPLLIAGVGFGASVMLGLIQLKDHYPRPR